MSDLIAILSTLILGSAILTAAQCQSDEVLIYGEVTLKNNEHLQGHIRWGREKVMWNDILYSDKRENTVKYFLSGEEIDRLELNPDKGRYSWSFLDLWDPAFTEELSLFKIYFGYIRQISFTDRDRIHVELKDGIRLEISDDDDMDDDIYIYDSNRRMERIRLKDIKQIRFLPTPSRLPDKHGDPIYGTVYAEGAAFTGYLIWNDECCLTDFMSGKSNSRTERHPYRDIRSVENLEKGFRVILKDGEEKTLCCTDDLNKGHLTVIIKTVDYGHIEIPMRDIRLVTFEDPPGQGPVNGDFKTVSRISGRIVTNDDNSLRGRLIYDLDEAFTCELLDGESGDREYRIPFQLVRDIRPVNRDITEVTLRNGSTINLSGHRDVNSRNNGCLVENPRGDFIYIPWEKIREISF